MKIYIKIRRETERQNRRKHDTDRGKREGIGCDGKPVRHARLHMRVGS